MTRVRVVASLLVVAVACAGGGDRRAGVGPLTETSRPNRELRIDGRDLSLEEAERFMERPEEPGDAFETRCADLPLPSVVPNEMDATGCWRLAVPDSDGTPDRCQLDDCRPALFIGGTHVGGAPTDRSRGAIYTEVPEWPGQSAIGGFFPLAPGTGAAVIHAISLEAACLTTADGRAWAFLIASARVVPAGEAPCPEPPRYEVGSAFRVPCAELPEPRDGLLDASAHDCWRFAWEERILGWAFGGVLEDGRGWLFASLPGVMLFDTVERGLVSEFLDGGDVTIYRITLERICFTTERGGPGAFDLEAGRLVPEGEPTGCPAPEG